LLRCRITKLLFACLQKSFKSSSMARMCTRMARFIVVTALVLQSSAAKNVTDIEYTDCFNLDTQKVCGGECATKGGCQNANPDCDFEEGKTDKHGNPIWCYEPKGGKRAASNCYYEGTRKACGPECATKTACLNANPKCKFRAGLTDVMNQTAWCYFPAAMVGYGEICKLGYGMRRCGCRPPFYPSACTPPLNPPPPFSPPSLCCFGECSCKCDDICSCGVVDCKQRAGLPVALQWRPKT